jgi:hypothetical protein
MDERTLFLVGLIASVTVWLLAQLSIRFGYTPKRFVLTVILYVVSVLLALRGGVELPMRVVCNGDIPACVDAYWLYANQWLLVAAPVLATATIIYNVLYEKVIIALNSKAKAFMKKIGPKK